MLRADLHIHTRYSMDCTTSPQALIRRCQKKGINCIAVTDHGTTAGGVKTKELAPFPVIVGQEVLAQEGEILGFFLQEDIPSGLPCREAVDRIRAQGGLVGVPHPFDQVYRLGLGRRLIESLLPHIQIIEGFNARSLGSQDSVAEFAHQHGLALSAGSDAHTLWEVGNAYVEMPPFTTPEEFLRSLAQGVIKGKRSPYWIHAFSTWQHLILRLKGKR